MDKELNIWQHIYATENDNPDATDMESLSNIKDMMLVIDTTRHFASTFAITPHVTDIETGLLSVNELLRKMNVWKQQHKLIVSVTWMMFNSLKYLATIGKKMSVNIIEEMEQHTTNHDIEPCVIAYYRNYEDFRHEWCDQLGYSESEADEILKSDSGEFQMIDDFGIIRYAI